jgi:CRISPR/Cas system-associated exonuclease Cas4 (RecB family)
MPSTSALLLLADQRRPRSQQRAIGVSDLGGCRKRAGYKLSGAEPTDASGSVQAVMGSAIHDAVANVLQEMNLPGYLVEREVRFAGIVGHLDRYEADTKTLVDVKTTSSRWLEHIRVHGPELNQMWQVNIYAAALISEGVDVRKVRIDYLVRDSGKECQFEFPFQPHYVRQAMEWLKTVRETPIAMLPRDHQPESVFCQGCPYRSKCWGAAIDERYAETAEFVDRPDAEEWLEALVEVQAQLKELTSKQDRIRKTLDAVRPDEGGVVVIGSRALRFYQTATGKWAFRVVGWPSPPAEIPE